MTTFSSLFLCHFLVVSTKILSVDLISSITLNFVIILSFIDKRFFFLTHPLGLFFILPWCKTKQKIKTEPLCPTRYGLESKNKRKHLLLISFCFLTLSSPCGYPVQPARSGGLTDKSHLHASAPVHQRHSRWLTSEAGVKLNVPKGNKFSLACKLKSDRRATQHKAFLIPFAALGKRNTSNLWLRVGK